MISLEVGRLFSFYVKHEILGVGRGTRDYFPPKYTLLPDTRSGSIQRGGRIGRVIDLSQTPEGPQNEDPVDAEELLTELAQIKENARGITRMPIRRW